MNNRKLYSFYVDVRIDKSFVAYNEENARKKFLKFYKKLNKDTNKSIYKYWYNYDDGMDHYGKEGEIDYVLDYVSDEDPFRKV